MLPGGLDRASPSQTAMTFFSPRHLKEPEIRPELAKTFSRLVPWVSRINELQPVHDPHPGAKSRDERTREQMPGPEEFGVFLVLFQTRWTRERACGLWANCRTDEMEGKATLVPPGLQDPAKRQVVVLSAQPIQGTQPESRNPFDLWPSLRQKIPVNCWEGSRFGCLHCSLRETGLLSEASL